MSILTTPREVVDALGGLTAVARLLTKELHRNYLVQAIYKWRNVQRITDIRTYPVLRAALEKEGYIADPAIWGFSRADVANAVETAIGLAEFYGTGDAGKLSAIAAAARTPRPNRRRQRAATPSKPSKSVLNRENQMRMQI